MNRVELIKTLELIRPALASNNLVPVFQCYVFDGGTIGAYNDQLAIFAQSPETVKEPFAVNGTMLFGLLSTSEGDEAEFKIQADHILLKTGKTNSKLPFFKKDEFVFEDPDNEWELMLMIDDDLIAGIKACLTTSSRDYTQGALMGVCFNADEGAMYSCDGDAVTKYKISCKGKGRYTVSNEFCDALMKIRGDQPGGVIHINSQWSYAELRGYHVYGRMIENPADLDHEKLIENTLGDSPTFVPVPLGLNEALSRARVVADGESKHTVLTVHKGKLVLETTSHMGYVTDEVTMRGQGNVTAHVHASLVQRSLAQAEEMAILANCTGYAKGNKLLQVVSNVSE